MPTAQFIPRTKTPLAWSRDMLVHPRYNRIYIGGILSQDPDRKNLTVITSLGFSGPVQTSKDAAFPLPVGNMSSIMSLALHPSGDLLYVLLKEETRGATAVFAYYITIFPLSETGDVMESTARSYILLNNARTRTAYYDNSVVHHPTLNLLYVTDESNVQVYQVDPMGYFINATGTDSNELVPDTLLQWPVADFLFTSLHIHENGQRLYAGTYPGSTAVIKDNFIVAKLTAGLSGSTDCTVYPDDPLPFDFVWQPNSYATILQPFYLFATSKAIYRSARIIDGQYAGRTSAPLRVWRLDEMGDPIDHRPDPASPKPTDRLERTDINGNGGCFFPVSDTLFASQMVYFNDLADNSKKIGGFSVLSYGLDAQGRPAQTGTTLAEIYTEEPFLMRAKDAPGAGPVVLTKEISYEILYPKDVVQAKDQYLRCAITQSDPKLDWAKPWDIWIADNSLPLANQPSPPQFARLDNNGVAIIPLGPVLLQDRNLQNINQRVMIYLNLSSKAAPAVDIAQASWKIEYFQGAPSPSNNAALNTLQDTTYGDRVVVIVDGYNVQEGGLAGRAARFELLSAQWIAWEQSASQESHQNAQIRDYIISAFAFSVRQAHGAQLSAMCRLVKDFGFNTMIVGIGDKSETETLEAFPAGTLINSLHAGGINKFMAAVYNPYSGSGVTSTGLEDFDFYLGSPGVDLNKWARDLSAPFRAYLAGETISNFMIRDEPGWSYVDTVGDLLNTNNANALINFQTSITTWLRSVKMLTAAYFGLPAWAAVQLACTSVLKNIVVTVVTPKATVEQIAESDGLSPGEKKLYYWTLRFLQLCAINGYYDTRLALQNTFPGLMTTPTDLNSQYADWKVIGQRTLADGKTKIQTPILVPDWFEAGRQKKQDLWTESWFPDNDLWEWSFITDLLYSAANSFAMGATNGEAKNSPIGGYVVGDSLGGHPAGAMYKLFTLLSRNGKIADFYSLGIYDGTNPWVMFPEIYPAIADSIRLLAAAEAYLYAASPVRGYIAILSTGLSTIWDNVASANYKYDMMGTYLALLHEGYTVDFVDDDDIANGCLRARGYYFLYVTGPNLSDAAGAEIENWVATKGGILVASPGAACKNEFNETSVVLDPVLGLKTVVDPDLGVIGRSEYRQFYAPSTSGNTPNNGMVNTVPVPPPLDPGALPPPYGAAFPGIFVNVIGDTQLQEIPVLNILDNNEINYKFSSGEPAVIAQKHGSGNGILFNFFPGIQYLNSRYDVPTGHQLSQLTKWRRAHRAFSLIPLAYHEELNFKQVTLSNDMIEARLMQSPDYSKFAIILFNLSSEPQHSIDIHVIVPRLFKAVRSAQGTTITNIKFKTKNKLDGLFVQCRLKTLQYVDVIMVTQ